MAGASEDSRTIHALAIAPAARRLQPRYANDSPMVQRPDPYAAVLRLPDGPVQVTSLLAAPCSRVEVEIGPGRGGFLFERLVSCAEAGLIGLEIRRKWAHIVNSRLEKQGFGGRARVYADDAKDAMRRLQPDGCLDAVFVHFPDPWWKKRHAKRLVLGRPLLDEVARLLKPGADLFVQTDVPERAEAYEAQIEDHGAFVPHGDAPGSARMAANPYGATSHRERRAVDDQIPIHRLRYLRRTA